MSFQLPALPYALEALEPHISRRTLEFHHGKHHQAYVNNLNGLIPGTEFESYDLETIVLKSEGGIFNNAAQIWNHSFYFDQFSPSGGGVPQGKLAEALARAFGSFDQFKEQFSKASATLFGSGWAWLVMKPDGGLDIVQEPNAGNPMKRGLVPLMTCDVWEHAYYIDYQNRRPDYIASFWQVINWQVIENRMLK